MSEKSVSTIDLYDPWKEITVKSWAFFDESIEELGYRQCLFRGQADSTWGLRTSLDRSFKTNQEIILSAKGKKRSFAKIDHEKFLIKSFQKYANMYLKFLPPDEKKLEWLAIMQHYGAPTRLLDVTLSPHVATFFALESGTGDSSIFVIRHTELQENNKFFISKENYIEMQYAIFDNNERIVSVFNPEYGNERLFMQQGLFLIPSNIDLPLHILLKDYQDFADNDVCIKYIIPAKLRLSGLERLKSMNITSATLFPGIDGFSKSLKFQVLETIQNQKLLE
jgi:hypothetical protein